MVYYSEDPNLTPLKTVVTVKGDTEYRRNTKFIKEKYYTINRDCIQFDEKWYRLDGGNILFDYELKTYFLKDRMPYGLLRGIVEEDGKLSFGFFTKNPFNNVFTHSRAFGKVNALNTEILEKNGWFEDLGLNYWVNPSDYTKSEIEYKKKVRNEKSFTDKGYNIEDNADFESKIENQKKYNLDISLKAREMEKYFGDLTFGLEIELQQGCLPDNLRNRFGAVICRDGSLNGGAEIVSVPLSGAKGLQTAVDLANALKNRSTIDLNCSLHIHFGNFRTDKLFIIALYRLSRCIQNELFTMFPYYKTEPNGYKQKNYTKKLLKLNINSLKSNSKDDYELYIQDSWAKLFNFYSEGKISLEDFNKKTRQHPIQRKWEQKNRYFYMNFMNLFFGHRHTMEARLHSGTTNSHKIINWLFICAAIIKYTEKYTKELITTNKAISLKEILDIYPTLFHQDKKAHFLSKYLYEYFKQRQERCEKDFKNNDFVSQWDILEDKTYEFSYDGVKGLI